MKTISLQEKYERDQMNLMLENLDQSDLQNIANAFEKIDNILGDLDTKLPSINGPMEKARQNITTMLSGEGGILKRMFRGVTGQQEKVIRDVIETQVQLVSLFRAFPSIMVLAGKGLKQKLAQAPGGQKRVAAPGEEMGDSGLIKDNTVADAIGDPNAIKNLERLISKALKPDAIRKSSINPQKAAREIMNLAPDELSQLAKRAGGSQLRVPIPKEDMQSISAKADDQEDMGSGARAQQLVQSLTKGDKDRAKVMKSLIDQLSGLTGQDVKLVKQGLDKFLGFEEPSPPPMLGV